MTEKETLEHTRKVVIVPCSGIGKTYGTVSREAAYDVTQDLRPEDTELVALAMLVRLWPGKCRKTPKPIYHQFVLSMMIQRSSTRKFIVSRW